jgi:two-component system, NarL family, invasion response regulator UvrY
MNKNATIALVDDHVLLRNGLAALINSFNNYRVLFEADHGKNFVSKVDSAELPDIVLMDIHMPEMDGYETTSWIRENHPQIKVLALSMYDNEAAIIRMFKAGARGYILKDSDPYELESALNSLVTKGYYYTEMVTGRLIHSINAMDDDDSPVKGLIQLNEREITFLKLVCSELTYKEIADQMVLSPRTIDGYRDALFDKLNLKTRVGLVMYAIKNGIVCL